MHWTGKILFEESKSSTSFPKADFLNHLGKLASCLQRMLKTDAPWHLYMYRKQFCMMDGKGLGNVTCNRGSVILVLLPLAKWSCLRFPSSVPWVQSHPVDQYVCTGHPVPMLIVYSHPILMGQGSVMGHWTQSSMLHAH